MKEGLPEFKLVLIRNVRHVNCSLCARMSVLMFVCVCVCVCVYIYIYKKRKYLPIYVIVQGKYGIVNALASFIQEKLDDRLKYNCILMMIECKFLNSIPHLTHRLQHMFTQATFSKCLYNMYKL
jgi:hypothetical protein